MNQLVSIDVAVASLTPEIVFAPGGVEDIVSKIEAEVSTEVFTLDTTEGRKRIKSVAYKVARSKTTLDEMGKELVAGIKAQAATIDAERRIIRERLDALRDRVCGPLTAWEDAEAARVANHESVLVWIVQAWQLAGPTAATIRERIAALDNEADRDWQEFAERATAACQESREKLAVMLAAAEQAERDAAELAELRRLKAEREVADAAAAVAAQEAERVRIFNENRDRLAAEWTAKAARDTQEAAERAERAEREKIEAVARAVEQERERVARAKADEERDAAKREANKKHRAKVHAEIIANLIPRGFSEGPAGNIVSWLAEGSVPHVSIQY